MSELTAEQLKVQFIGWQCRIRQYSVRKDEGVPSTGMRPNLEVKGQQLGSINLALIKSDSADITAEFRFIIQKTEDPKARYESAIKVLSEYYYQLPAEFDEEMTAVYSIDSELAQQIAQVGVCHLEFQQANQKYNLQCHVRKLSQEELKYSATYWHNHLFNPSMPGSVTVLGFLPDWNNSSFETIDVD